ncbi:MAG: 16S rRNA (adenine(1518)-N(6)/adenine(1519)-N(6))-dimethyltransferase RsmA [Planctomycetota bacterium]|jgi:16S rRNA (adenine1518-N6/adenine1519-N6)-dimethyltransferase|nr:16S rRNA (adenine(1518)-N(6)/adenine(1519)-N(6))-dimethyltransferase RsmA [Planctomycetota bacterium]
MSILRKLRARLDRHGLKPSIRRGQNFLLDRNQLGFIVDAARLGPNDVVLEVGPGSGFLTRRLARTGALVFSVEIDRGLLPLAMEETEGLPNVVYLLGDILAGKNALNPEAMARLAELVELRRGRPGSAAVGKEPVLKSVSNLPYSAGTAFIMNLFASPLPWTTGVFLLQREVAERMCASPGGKEYGAVSIGAGLAGTASIERIVPPGAFWPRPNVDSAVLRMEFLPVDRRSRIPWRGIRRIASAVFGSRRKILKNALKGVYRGREAGDVLAEARIAPECRGETLGPGEFRLLGEMWERAEEPAEASCRFRQRAAVGRRAMISGNGAAGKTAGSPRPPP